MTLKEKVKKIIPSFVLNFYHYLLALTGAFLYGFPGRKIKVIGVTGTKGKSTTVEFISKIFEEAGYKTALLSSVKFKIGDREWKNALKMTMPGRFKIQKFLRQAVKNKCQYAVLEVTSEGIKQHRHRFIDFDAAVFTNLSPEHIESHGGFDNYRKAKSELFRKTKNIHIINLDDKNAQYFLSISAKEKYGFRIRNQELGIRNNESGIMRNIKIIEAKKTDLKENCSLFIIHNSLFKIYLLGRFNVYNALAAVCVGLSQGISLETSKSALEKIKGIPGRMEIVVKEPFKAIVDYAHSPDSLEAVYNNFKNKPLICVLGSCGGGRDKWKRPVLGEIAAKYCKEIIITNEDPYDENPMEIINQVAEGAKGKARKILDRREAIRKALKSAKPNDIVIITGKGSEVWMCVENGKKISWSDKEIVKEEFNKLFKSEN